MKRQVGESYSQYRNRRKMHQSLLRRYLLGVWLVDNRMKKHNGNTFGPFKSNKGRAPLKQHVYPELFRDKLAEAA